MSKSPASPPPDDKKKALQILGPVAAVAAVVVLIGVVVGIGGSSSPSTAKSKPGDPPANSSATMAGKFDFPLDGPEWKEIGEGLKIWDVKEGTGEPCPEGANVKVHYVGWLTNGNQFDSSIARGEPSTFGLDEVIKGWTRGIPGLKIGGVRRFLIPGPLAYPDGRRGIPPNADLVFEVEMLSFQ